MPEETPVQETNDQPQSSPEAPVLSEQEVQGLQSAKATADIINSASSKYNIDPKMYVQQAEAGWNTIKNLIDQGVIDEQGNVKTSPQQEQEYIPPAQEPSEVSTSFDGNKLESIVAKALRPYQDKIEAMERDQNTLIRMDLQRQVQQMSSSFDSNDASQVLTIAMKDKSLSLNQHAEKYAEQKKTWEDGNRKKYAKEFNINLDEFDSNQLKEQSAEGGAASMYQGKTFSFGNDGINPKNAAREYLATIKQ